MGVKGNVRIKKDRCLQTRSEKNISKSWKRGEGHNTFKKKEGKGVKLVPEKEKPLNVERIEDAKP